MWVVDYLSSGKGVIPYGSIKIWEDLNKVPPTDNVFPKTDFYSSLKNTIISDEEDEDVKKLFNLLKCVHFLT